VLVIFLFGFLELVIVKKFELVMMIFYAFFS